MEPVNYKEIYEIFKKYKAIFPHIRQDYLKRMIAAGNVIFEDGVVIVYQKYKKKTRLGDYSAKAGTYMLHQIVNANVGNGNTEKVFNNFLAKVIDDESDGIVLTVRANNGRACKFYEQMSFEKVGTISWKSGEIPGVVYFLDVSNTPGDFGAWQ